MDGSVERVYEVACDELHCTPAGNQASHPLAIPDQGTISRTRALAQARSAPGADTFDLVLYPEGKERTPGNRRVLTRQILVELGAGGDAATLARDCSAVDFEEPSYASGYVILKFAQVGDSLTKLEALRLRADVESADPILARAYSTRFVPNDPLYAYNAGNPGYQWHLHNTGQNSATAGIDVNVEGAWDSYTGAGIRIGILDQGIQLNHPDLAGNIDTVNDHNFLNGDADDPSPLSTVETHGTSVAGLAAAKGNNNLGVSGVAFDSTLVGLRLILPNLVISDLTEANAFSWKNDLIQIKNSSWGPEDTADTLAGPGALTKAAFLDGVTNGRGGLGTIFVSAAGNGFNDDNVNYDGYANSIYTIAVGAINDRGVRSDFSEPGAAKLISAPSNNTEVTTPPSQGITTTNFQTPALPEDYRHDFSGTSASAPMVSGVCALMLEANPNLGWRDVQEILIRTARRIDASNPGWVANGAGIWFSHDYGAGLVDASAAVTAASTWTNLGPQESAFLEVSGQNLPIPAVNAPVSQAFNFSLLDPLRVEHATVALDIEHPDRGDLRVTLTSPSGKVSELTALHDDYTANFDLSWEFMSVHHWGENSTGVWNVTVYNEREDAPGVFHGAVVTLYGVDSATLNTAPQITSALTAEGAFGLPFLYQITAQNVPTSYGATSLPNGLTINATSGLIEGLPLQAGQFSVTISATNDFGTDTETLVLNIDSVSLNEALDEHTLVFSTSGNAAWFGQKQTTFFGGDAAQTLPIDDSQSAVLSTSVTGPGTISFQWKVSSERRHDQLIFRISGSNQAVMSGNVDWAPEAFNVPAGTHTLSWTYSKDGGTIENADTAYLDALVYTPGASLPTVSLPEAVDYHALSWTASGSQWHGQMVDTHDGEDAAVCSNLANSATATLSTTVTGPGMLTFYWKCSTETVDKATFKVNGTTNSIIDGETDWVQRTVTIPSGSQTLTWQYTKDSSDAAGQDRVWVDQVVWAPTGITGFNLWRNQNFTLSQQSDAAVGQEASNPDADDWNNLFEYTFDTDPFGFNGDPLTGSVVGGSYTGSYSYRQKSDVSVDLERSEDLDRWAPQGISRTVSNGVNTDTFTIPIPSNLFRLFLRFNLLR